MANSNGNWTPGNIKPGGWLVILIITGLIYWYGIKPHSSGLPAYTFPTMPGLPFGANNGSPAAPASSGAEPSPSSGTANGSASGADILVLTTGTKQKWLTDEINKFNSQSQTGHAELDVMESRDGMQKMLAGAEQPDIWSPSSTVWSERLAEIGPGKGIHIHEDEDDYRTLFQSPLVFLVVKDQLPSLQPILSGRHPFDALARLQKYKFAYADPLNASSGMLTMSLLLNEYADIHNTADLDSVANSLGFAFWLRKVDKCLSRENTQGSSALESDFESNPGERAFITAYESAALNAVQNNPNLAIVYPDPTANATQVAVFVDGPWTTDAKRATATAFLNFITSDAASQDALNYYFRPAYNGGDALEQKVQSTAASAYFHHDFRTLGLPSYEAINDANVLFHEQDH